MGLYVGCTEAVYQPRRFWGLCTEAVYQPRRFGDCVLKLCISQVDLDQVSFGGEKNIYNECRSDYVCLLLVL